MPAHSRCDSKQNPTLYLPDCEQVNSEEKWENMSAGEPAVKRQLLDTGQADRSGASRTDSEVQARLEDCYPVKCLCSVPEEELERYLSRGWTGIKQNQLVWLV